MNKTIEDHEISAAMMMGFLEARLAKLETELAETGDGLTHFARTRLSARTDEAREALIHVEKTVSLLKGCL